MITLTFTTTEVRKLLINNGGDRLAALLLDKVLPDKDNIVLTELMKSVQARHWLSNVPFASINKIFWIREVREASSNNNKILNLFGPDDIAYQGGVLGLAGAKRWIENNTRAIDEALRI